MKYEQSYRELLHALSVYPLLSSGGEHLKLRKGGGGMTKGQEATSAFIRTLSTSFSFFECVSLLSVWSRVR